MERQKKHNNNNVHISTQEKSERENYTKVVMQKQMLLPATSYNKRDQKSEKKIEIKDPTAATESTTQQSSSRYVVYCTKELIHIYCVALFVRSKNIILHHNSQVHTVSLTNKKCSSYKYCTTFEDGY